MVLVGKLLNGFESSEQMIMLLKQQSLNAENSCF